MQFVHLFIPEFNHDKKSNLIYTNDWKRKVGNKGNQRLLTPEGKTEGKLYVLIPNICATFLSGAGVDLAKRCRTAGSPVLHSLSPPCLIDLDSVLGFFHESIMQCSISLVGKAVIQSDEVAGKLQQLIFSIGLVSQKALLVGLL